MRYLQATVIGLALAFLIVPHAHIAFAYTEGDDTATMITELHEQLELLNDSSVVHVADASTALQELTEIIAYQIENPDYSGGLSLSKRNKPNNTAFEQPGPYVQCSAVTTTAPTKQGAGNNQEVVTTSSGDCSITNLPEGADIEWMVTTTLMKQFGGKWRMVATDMHYVRAPSLSWSHRNADSSCVNGRYQGAVTVGVIDHNNLKEDFGGDRGSYGFYTVASYFSGKTRISCQ